MNKNETEHALKMLSLIKIDNNKRGIGIVIERFGEPELVLIWDLQLHEEKGETYDFFEYFENLEDAKNIYFRNTTIYIHGENSHIFILLNALISKNPKRIVYKRDLVSQDNKQIAEWYYARKRAQLRKLELIEM